MAVQHLINHRYSEGCVGDRFDESHRDEVPDCGHFSCGLLCDVAIESWRAGDSARADYHEATQAGETGLSGDQGRSAIQALLDDGMTLSRVAEHLYVHPRHVVLAVVRAGDYVQVLHAEELLRAGTMVREEVARRSGLSHQQVGRLAEAIHAPIVKHEQTDAEQTARIVELREAGWSVRQIAAELGISKSAVSRRRPAIAEPALSLSA